MLAGIPTLVVEREWGALSGEGQTGSSPGLPPYPAYDTPGGGASLPTAEGPRKVKAPNEDGVGELIEYSCVRLWGIGIVIMECAVNEADGFAFARRTADGYLLAVRAR